MYYKSTLQLHPIFEYTLQGMWANDYLKSISLFRSIIQVFSKYYKVAVIERKRRKRKRRSQVFPVKDFVAMRR